MAVDAGSGSHSGGGPAFAGSALAAATCLSRSELRGGGVLHLARTPGSPGFCHACSPLPRGWLEDGLCAAARPAAEAKSTARAIRDVISSTPGSDRALRFSELTCVGGLPAMPRRLGAAQRLYFTRHRPVSS